MSILDKIKRLKELEGKATPGPWESKEEKDNKCLIISPNEPVADVYNFYPTTQFIAESRNALPEILECLESALKYAMAHKEHCDHNKIDYSEEQMEFLKKVGIE